MTAPEQTDGIDSDLYSDDSGSTDKGSEQQQPKSVDDEAAEAPTGLIPKSLLGSQKPSVGQTITLKIVADHGDELEVENASESNDDETGDESGANEELDSMDQSNS